MWLGVDYYPEQWHADMLEQDLDTIVELGCNVIRIAEFSWHLMEKREGQYDFSFFDHVIEKAKERNLKIIMGTPTATIPAWLAANIRILFLNLRVEKRELLVEDMCIVSIVHGCMNILRRSFGN